jgi:hypothetical protein
VPALTYKFACVLRHCGRSAFNCTVGISSKKIATMTDPNSMLMLPYGMKIKAFIETMVFMDFG